MAKVLGVNGSRHLSMPVLCNNKSHSHFHHVVPISHSLLPTRTLTLHRRVESNADLLHLSGIIILSLFNKISQEFLVHKGAMKKVCLCVNLS